MGGHASRRMPHTRALVPATARSRRAERQEELILSPLEKLEEPVSLVKFTGGCRGPVAPSRHSGNRG
jgi:hypothetical protein